MLYRSKDGLGVRCPGEFRVDNKPCKDRCDVPLPSVVTAEGFTFALEPVGPRLRGRLEIKVFGARVVGAGHRPSFALAA